MGEFEKPIVKLKNWSAANLDAMNPYIAPECRRTGVQGNVYGHPNFTDGDHVVSSPILAVNGRRLETKNTIYELEGDPDPLYVEYLTRRNLVLSPENPFKIHH